MSCICEKQEASQRGNLEICYADSSRIGLEETGLASSASSGFTDYPNAAFILIRVGWVSAKAQKQEKWQCVHESPRMVAGPHEVRVTNKEPVSQLLAFCSLALPSNMASQLPQLSA